LIGGRTDVAYQRAAAYAGGWPRRTVLLRLAGAAASSEGCRVRVVR